MDTSAGMMKSPTRHWQPEELLKEFSIRHREFLEERDNVQEDIQRLQSRARQLDAMIAASDVGMERLNSYLSETVPSTPDRYHLG